jgi:hypothetical protein
MNIAESLVGHLLTRNGIKYLIIKAHDTTVVGAYRDKAGTLQRILIPLAEALQCLDDVNQVDLPDAAEPAEPKFTLV